jgi:hypothetical protein
MCFRGREHISRGTFHLWLFLCGRHKENCVVKITDGRAQVNRFLLHFSRLKKGKEEVMPFYKRLRRSLSTPKAHASEEVV